MKESERVEALRERALIVVEAEKRLSKSHTYHRFMHFVEPVDSTGKSQEMVWEGVTRRVTELVRAKTDCLEAELARVKNKLDAQDSKLDMILAKLHE